MNSLTKYYVAGDNMKSQNFRNYVKSLISHIPCNIYIKIKRFSQYFDISNFILKPDVTYTMYERYKLTLFNKIREIHIKIRI